MQYQITIISRKAFEPEEEDFWIRTFRGYEMILRRRGKNMICSDLNLAYSILHYSIQEYRKEYPLIDYEWIVEEIKDDDQNPTPQNDPYEQQWKDTISTLTISDKAMRDAIKELDKIYNNLAPIYGSK